MAAVVSLGLGALSPVPVAVAADTATPAAVTPAAVTPAAATPAAATPAAATPAAATPAAAPVIEGSYDVSGITAVDKTKYEGVILLAKKGEAYKANYQDSDGTHIGIASAIGNVLAVAFSTADKPIVCMMEPDGTSDWKGHCVEQGEKFLNKENWKRR